MKMIAIDLQVYQFCRQLGIPALAAGFVARDSLPKMSSYDLLMQKGLCMALQDRSVTIERYEVAKQRDLPTDHASIGQHFASINRYSHRTTAMSRKMLRKRTKLYRID